jgi:putative colanic acid biosynthesis acetyltransferase WcaF
MSDSDASPPKIQNLEAFDLPKNFRGRSAVTVQLWWLVQGVLFHPSPQFMYGWRRFLLRLFGAQIGRNVLIRPSVRVTYPWKLIIGDYSWIGDFAELYNLGEIVIGANAVVSQYTYLCTGSHDLARPTFDIFARPIIVEDEAWIAAAVFVHPGVTIGKGSVVGARSVIHRSTEPGWVYSGSPATRLRMRVSDDRRAAGGLS